MMTTKEWREMMEQQEKVFRAWTYPPGKPVILIEDNGRETKTITRSKPWLSEGTALILVNDRSGGYRLDRLRPDEVVEE